MRALHIRSEEELEGVAGAFEAVARFVFRNQAVVDGAFAGVVDAIGEVGKIRIDAGELKVVVDLVEEIAEGGSAAVAGSDEALELRRELLLDGFFEDGAAHDRTGGEEAIEVAAGGFVKVAVGLFGAGRSDHAFAEFGSAVDGGFDEIEELEDEGGAQKVVLLGVEGALDGLPSQCGRGALAGLKADERGEALARVLNEPVTHLMGELTPVGDEGVGVLAIASAQLGEDDPREDAAEAIEAVGACELGDGFAEFAARCFIGGLGEELLLELGDVDGHGAVRLSQERRTDEP